MGRISSTSLLDFLFHYQFQCHRRLLVQAGKRRIERTVSVGNGPCDGAFDQRSRSWDCGNSHILLQSSKTTILVLNGMEWPGTNYLLQFDVQFACTVLCDDVLCYVVLC